MKRIAIVVASLALIGYAALGIHTIVSKQQLLDIQQVKLQNTSTKIKDLQLKYDQVNSNLEKELHQNNADQEKVKSLESEKQDLQKQKEDLEQQLQAKADAKAKANQLASNVVNKVTGTATAYADAPADGDKAFIYAKESGNNPGAINASSGACGLGQALPCSKMPCSLSDYACQDQFFTAYMTNRYGTWANARAFWEAHRWW